MGQHECKSGAVGVRTLDPSWSQGLAQTPARHEAGEGDLASDGLGEHPTDGASLDPRHRQA